MAFEVDVVIELFDGSWRWLDVVLGFLCSSYAAQEFVDVHLQNQKGKSSIVVQVLDLVLEAAVQDGEAKVGAVDD